MAHYTEQPIIDFGNATIPEAHLSSGRYAQALEAAQKRIDQLKPELVSAYMNKGHALQLMKLHEDAAIAFQCGLNLSPDDITLQEGKKFSMLQMAEDEKARGNVFFQRKDYQTALTHYSKAIEKNSSNAKFFSNRAACYYHLGQLNLALQDATEALRLDPNFIRGHMRKGHILSALKDFSQAAESFKKALDIDSSNQEALKNYEMCVTASTQRTNRILQKPEVQEILRDETVLRILDQIQNEPQALQAQLNDQHIVDKIAQLIRCGLLAII